MSNVDSLIALLKTLRMDTAVRISDSQWDACIKLGTNMELKNNQGVVDALIEALEPNNLTKAHAAEAFGTFGNIGDDRVVEKLIVSLKDPYRLVRSYSARALGKQNNEKAIPDLIERLKIDDFFGVRAEAAEALVIICSNSQSTECKKARKELEDAKVRKGQRRNNAGIEEDPNKRVVNEAIEAIEKIEESVKTIDRHVQKGINTERANVEDAKRREENCPKAHPSYES